ncbi:MAG: hypothetical protein HUU10_13505 [Bacteroidetes bacterium]|nr:hypothetical protein [Bacteroidota bacterium]
MIRYLIQLGDSVGTVVVGTAAGNAGAITGRSAGAFFGGVFGLGVDAIPLSAGGVIVGWLGDDWGGSVGSGVVQNAIYRLIYEIHQTIPQLPDLCVLSVVWISVRCPDVLKPVTLV